MAERPPFAQALEQLREARGLTPAQLARELNEYEGNVSRWRRGQGIELVNVRKIAEYFGVDSAWLERLAGYGDSAPSPTKESIDAERQLWRSRFDYMMEKRVPKWAWEAYMTACEALGEAYQQMRPGALNNAGPQTLNRSGTEIEPGASGAEERDLTDLYRPHASTYRFETASA